MMGNTKVLWFTGEITETVKRNKSFSRNNVSKNTHFDYYCCKIEPGGYYGEKDNDINLFWAYGIINTSSMINPEPYIAPLIYNGTVCLQDFDCSDYFCYNISKGRLQSIYRAQWFQARDDGCL